MAGQGFSLKNKYTGKYLHDALSAKYDDPVYFTFCTLGLKSDIALPTLSTQHPALNTVYTLDGRRVDAKSLKPGMYIKNGKKFIVR